MAAKEAAKAEAQAAAKAMIEKVAAEEAAAKQQAEREALGIQTVQCLLGLGAVEGGSRWRGVEVAHARRARLGDGDAHGDYWWP